MADTLTFTMKIDASDLKRLMGSGGGSMTVDGVGKRTDTDETPAVKREREKQNNTSLLGAATKLTAVLAVMDLIKSNSTIANTYLGAMGKVFGAAIDLLLLPFVPVFNLIMIGMMKFVEWFLTNKDLQSFIKDVAKNAEKFVLEIGKIADLILQGKWTQALELVINLLKISIENLLGESGPILKFLGHLAIDIAKELGKILLGQAKSGFDKLKHGDVGGALQDWGSSILADAGVAAGAVWGLSKIPGVKAAASGAGWLLGKGGSGLKALGKWAWGQTRFGGGGGGDAGGSGDLGGTDPAMDEDLLQAILGSAGESMGGAAPVGIVMDNVLKNSKQAQANLNALIRALYPAHRPGMPDVGLSQSDINARQQVINNFIHGTVHTGSGDIHVNPSDPHALDKLGIHLANGSGP